VAEIMRATAEQTRNSKHVAEAARRTSGMVQQIREVMGEQSRASETLLRSAEGSLELCRQVHRSSEAQREAGHLLGTQIEGLGELTRQVHGRAASQAASAQALIEAATRVLEGVRKSGGRMTPLLRRAGELGAEVRALAGEEPGPDQAADAASSPARATARPA
jgi:methyl-accepting chemotaxis protein